ncbi:MAG: LUD domain-containing protein [Bacteroidetes bacterium]|jgi:L-lactate dehydrogenase complex protein LldG|nr:LUD domain-containing protein [Bacteroidota bacterium]
MATSAAKENILKRIRQALSKPVPVPFPGSDGNSNVFTAPADDDAIVFAEAFTQLQGKFAFCIDEKDLRMQLEQLFTERKWTKIYFTEDFISTILTGRKSYDNLPGCDVSITGCEYIVARTGTIVLSSAQQSGRTTSVYAPVHICIAYSRQMLYDLQEALSFLKEKYKNNIPSQIAFATGPSRTADIEKTLVTGVHGPKEVFCFLVEA